MNIELKGRIDSNNAMQVEQEIQAQLQEGGAGCPVVLDAADLAYISSAGLRVLLGAAQAMDGKGDMAVRNLTQAVREVFELTGFSRVFNIE